MNDHFKSAIKVVSKWAEWKKEYANIKITEDGVENTNNTKH